MNPVEIKEVREPREWDAFLKLPWCLYQHDPLWIPPLICNLKRQLNAKKNPFFHNAEAKYWLAFKNGKCAGRIAAIINRQHNAHFSEKTGFWGYFECVDDASVSRGLFDAAHEWLRKGGMEHGRGPVNLSMNNECGFLINGIDRSPVIQMSYNPAYYPGLVESYGYIKEHDLLAYHISEEILENERLMRRLKHISEFVMQRENLAFRCFDTKNLRIEVEKIRELFNDFLSDCWGVVPMTKDEAVFMADSLKPVLVKELALFVEKDGQSIGCCLSVPDLNQVLKGMNGRLFPTGLFRFLVNRHRVTEIRLMLMGITKSFRKRGLEAVLFNRTIMEASKRKYRGAEMSWVSESNLDVIRVLESMHAKVYKRYRIYGMPLKAG